MKSIFLKLSLILLISFSAVQFLSAQGLNMKTLPNEKIQLGFRFDKPNFSYTDNTAALSGTYQVYINLPISAKFNLIADIPYVYNKYTVDYGFGEQSYEQKGFGNIFVGLQTRPEPEEENMKLISFGLYLPTVQEDASFYGLFTDYYEMSGFMPNSMSMYFNYAYHKISSDGFCYGFEGGPNILIPTKKNGSNTEVFVHYGAGAGFRSNKLYFGVELTGAAILTQDVEEFGDRFINMLDINASWDTGTITPKVFYKIYLTDNLKQFVDGVFGIGLNYAIDR